MFAPDITFGDRLTIAIPKCLHDAVREAARRDQLTVADYARRALALRLAESGISFPQLPNLGRRPGGQS